MFLSKIYNEIIKEYDLNQYVGKKNLHFGCGNKPLKGFINVDFYNKTYADDIVDLNKELPYLSESINLIYSDNVFEHINNLLELIRECNRVLKKGGVLIIKVPYFKSKHAFVDPTHINFFTIQSMNYYIKNTYFNDEYKFFDEAFESTESHSYISCLKYVFKCRL
jgi:SAM-dependent methyltransferase